MRSGIDLRVAHASDSDALAALCVEHAAFERDAAPPCDLAARLRVLQDDDGWRAWLAWEAGQVVGFVSGDVLTSTWQGARFWHIDCLYLREGWRRRGLGMRLLQHCIAHARERGLRWAEWQTPVWNEAACRFYRRTGAVGVAKQRFVLRLD